ncbi:MAG: MFS transporter [Mycobacterium leprae]
MMTLRNRALWIMASAGLVSNLGNWIVTQAVLALVVFKKGGGVGETTLIVLCSLLPTLLLGPAAGWLVDRFDRRLLMIASELLSGAVIAGLIFVCDAALSQIAWLYPFIVLAAAAGTVMGPARGSVIPDLVPPTELTRANAFLKQIDGLTKIFAPLMGAAIVAVVSPQVALLLDVISFVLSALILRLLPALPPRRAKTPAPAAPVAKSGALQNLRSVLRQAPLLQVMLPFNLVAGLVYISFDLTLAVYVRDILQGSIALEGLLVSLIGAGTGVAALVLMLLKGGRNLERDYLFGLVLAICLFAAVALGAAGGSGIVAQVIVMVGCLLGGLGIGLENVQGSTLVQRIAPDGWLGRINGSIQSVFTAGQAAGLLIAPLLVPHVVSFTLYFGVGTLVLLLLMLRTLRAIAPGHVSSPYKVNEVGSSD